MLKDLLLRLYTKVYGPYAEDALKRDVERLVKTRNVSEDEALKIIHEKIAESKRYKSVYEWLLEIYMRFYGIEGKQRLEEDIRSVEEQGYKRSEAIYYIAYFMSGETERFPPYLAPRRGLTYFLKRATDVVFANPSIVVGAFFEETANAIPAVVATIPLIALFVVMKESGAVHEALFALSSNPPEKALSAVADLLAPWMDWIVLALISSAILAFVAWVAFTGISYSMLYGSICESLSKGSTNLSSFPRFLQRWKAMSAVFLLANFVALIPAIALAIFAIIFIREILSLNVWILLILLILGLFSAFWYVLIRFLTLFVYPAVALGFGVKESLLKSLKTVRRRFGDSLLYVILRVVVVFLLGWFTSSFYSLPYASLSQIVALLTALYIVPVFYVAKTGLFMDDWAYSTVDMKAFEKRAFSTTYLKDLFSKSLRGTFSFLASPKGLGLFLLSLLIFGFAAWYAYPVGVDAQRALNIKLKTPTISISLYDISEAFSIFFNNWKIASTTSFSGIIPFVGIVPTLIINGMILGFFCGVYYERPLLFWAGILPHGVIELFSVFVAAASGFSLSLSAIRRKGFEENVRLVCYTSIALIPFFFIAALIEIYVTPIIMWLVG